MKNFLTFIDEKQTGTYVSIRFDDATNNQLKAYARSLDLTPIDNFHITVIYSEKKLAVSNGEFDFDGSAKIVGIDYLGEKDSKYRAIVLKLESTEINKLFNNYIVKYNYKNPYNEYIPHVSLAYKPKEGLDLSSIELPEFKLKFAKVITEELKND